MLHSKQRYGKRSTQEDCFLTGCSWTVEWAFVKCSSVLTDFCLARFVSRHMPLHRTLDALRTLLELPERPIIVIENSCVGTRDSEVCLLGVR